MLNITKCLFLRLQTTGNKHGIWILQVPSKSCSEAMNEVFTELSPLLDSTTSWRSVSREAKGSLLQRWFITFLLRIFCFSRTRTFRKLKVFSHRSDMYLATEICMPHKVYLLKFSSPQMQLKHGNFSHAKRYSFSNQFAQQISQSYQH